MLIKWELRALGPKLDLKLQCASSTRSDNPHTLDDHHIMMTRAQAGVLANYLFEVSGNTPPRPRPGFWRRWFS